MRTSKKQLQDCLNKKGGNLLQEYRKKCQECWLLVYADWEGPSSFYEMSADMKSRQYKSGFDRVYFLESFSNNISKLHLES